MAASSVVWALALSLTIVFTAGQCPGGAFTAPATTACCDNTVNTGVLFGAPKCCRVSGSTDCFCDPNPNNSPAGVDCQVNSEVTTQPPTTTDNPAPGADTTQPGNDLTTSEGATTTADFTTTAAGTTGPTTTDQPTTTDPPTTTPEPLCPVPGAVVGRILNAAPVAQRCDENGVVAFSLDTPDTTIPRVLLCHGVLAYNSNTTMRELWTSEYCWSQISAIYPLEGYNVYGTLLGQEFDVNDCFIGDAEVDSVGIARIKLPSITQVYFDGIASDLGCPSAACVPQESWRDRIATTGECFMISYGTTTELAPPIEFDGIAKKIVVRGEYRMSQCGTVDSGIAYTPNGADKICFISSTDGANCGTGDSSSPVFCYTDTMEPVLSAFTVPNQDCDPNQLTFPSDLV